MLRLSNSEEASSSAAEPYRSLYRRIMMTQRWLTGLAAFCAISGAAAASGQLHAQSVESFYSGRTVEVVIGAGMGGSYGLYSQLAAKYMSKYIPGNPTMVVRSRPGAGGQLALRYVYNAAPHDGSVLMLISPAVLFDTMLSKDPGYDAGKFQYIGRFVNNNYVGLVDARSGIMSLDDAKSRQVVFGALGARNALATGPAFVNRVAGAKIKIVTGYKGLARLYQAVDQKEVDGLNATVVNSRFLRFLDAYRKGEKTEFRPLYVISLRPSADLSGVPSVIDMKMSDAERAYLQIFASQSFLGRSLAFPPEVPKAYVDAFRNAFRSMLKDEAFRAEVARTKTLLATLDGEELQKTIGKIIDETPPDQVAKAAKVYEEVLSSLKK